MKSLRITHIVLTFILLFVSFSMFIMLFGNKIVVEAFESRANNLIVLYGDKKVSLNEIISFGQLNMSYDTLVALNVIILVIAIVQLFVSFKAFVRKD